jgi:NAD+ synthase
MSAVFATNDQLATHKEDEGKISYEATKREILDLYGVVLSEKFNAQETCKKRVAYLKDYMRRIGRKGFVLGISGGVDSSTAGRLAQIACQELRDEGYEANFYAVRLPAGIQRDEADAQDAIRFINPDKILTINIGETAAVLNAECVAAIEIEGTNLTPSQIDYHKGNVKARERMAAQYYLAAVYGAIVLGSDHTGEKISAFWTRGGDEIADALVLNGLSKRHVRLCAKHLGAPEHLWNKSPTADLEELNPGKLDDEGFGYPYEALNDFLEGKEIDPSVEAKIVAKYDATRYRRAPPVEFPG